MYIYIYILIVRNPPPLEEPPPVGQFFVGWFPNQEPGQRGPPLNNNPQY